MYHIKVPDLRTRKEIGNKEGVVDDKLKIQLKLAGLGYVSLHI